MKHPEIQILIFVIPVTSTSADTDHAIQTRDKSTSVLDDNTYTPGPSARESTETVNG